MSSTKAYQALRMGPAAGHETVTAAVEAVLTKAVPQQVRARTLRLSPLRRSVFWLVLVVGVVLIPLTTRRQDIHSALRDAVDMFGVLLIGAGESLGLRAGL